MKDEDPVVKTGVPYWHVWTDEDGVSRQARRRLTDFAFASVSEGAAPSDMLASAKLVNRRRAWRLTPSSSVQTCQ